MKVGDKVYCKPNCQYFLNDTYYIIYDISYSEVYVHLYSIMYEKKFLYNFSYNYFIKYFYTEKELRKLKLEKIHESR